MGLLDDLRSRLMYWLMPDEMFDLTQRTRLTRLATYHDYFNGEQKRQLAVSPEQKFDDNITVNLCKPVIDKAVSMLFGKPVKFDLPGPNDSDEQLALDKMWALNFQDKFLLKIGKQGAKYGTPFVKIIPDEYEDNIPRLVALDPFLMSIWTEPDDMDKIRLYRVSFTIDDPQTGTEIAKKEETIPNYGEDGKVISWTIYSYESNRDTGGKWVLTSTKEWEYDFPPIIHWQNLVNPESPYGESDLSGKVIELQDRINFISSNISKVIRFHGHPKTWGKGGGGPPTEKSWGADEIIMFPGEQAELKNLEMQSDLGSSVEFAKQLRQSLNLISRTTDITGIADKIGQLTNYAVKVFNTDSISKLNEKKVTYGDGLRELCRRMMIVAGNDAPEAISIRWPDPFPIDDKTSAEVAEKDLMLGLASKETISKQRGYDWNKEQERIDEERKSEEDLGTYLLKNFSKDKDAKEE